ncbi:MAG: DUF1800 family protein [Caulobacteraceae bacterium]
MRSSMSRSMAAGCAAAMLALPALAEPAPSPLSAHDLALLNRLTWGANPSSAAEMARLGPRRWLQRQLHPEGDRLPPEVQAQIDALPIGHEAMPDAVERFEAENRARQPDRRSRRQGRRAQEPPAGAERRRQGGRRPLPAARPLFARPAERSR